MAKSAREKIKQLGQKDEPLFKRTTVNVPVDLNEKIQFILENSDITISSLIADSLVEYDLDSMVKEIKKDKEMQQTNSTNSSTSSN